MGLALDDTVGLPSRYAPGQAGHHGQRSGRGLTADTPNRSDVRLDLPRPPRRTKLVIRW